MMMINPYTKISMLNAPTKVVKAFEKLLEEIEAEIEFANSAGIDGFHSQDYDRINEVLERVKKMVTLKEEIDKLRRRVDRAIYS